MLNTVWAVVRDGKIWPEEPVDLQDGQRVLVMLVVDEGREFWMSAADSALDAIWGNEGDDVYAELLTA